MTKILLIYTSLFKITGLPVGVASISAVLKQNGFQVKIFDTAFYNTENAVDETKLRENRLMSKPISNDSILRINDTNIFDDLRALILDFNPVIVGISIFESTYHLSVLLAKSIKTKFPNILVVAGGIFPTLSPEILKKEKFFDAICVGEGEIAFSNLCKRIADNEDCSDIKGIWLRKGETVIKNLPEKLVEINDLPFPDYTGFDSRMFYKPMQGRLFKMVNIETTRGCPYHCSYCAAGMLKKLYKQQNLGGYFRQMSIENIMKQIGFQIKTHNPDFIYFSSETFLSMNAQDFNIFVEEYKKIKLPFWFQTRFETISEERIKKLKGIGMYWLTLGLEHGNEDFRKKVLKRNYKNEAVVQGMNILKKYDVGATINNMLGFPLETRELIFDTIRINKKLFEINNKIETNIYLFVPFRGCELYKLCLELKLITSRDFSDTSDLRDDSVLEFSEKYKKMLKGIIRTFNLYIRLPKEYFQKIEIAERDDEKGNEMFHSLLKLIK